MGHRFKTLLLSTALLASGVHAMTLERSGADLFATGATVATDFVAFRQAFEQPGIERLVLVNAPGGDLWTGMKVSRMVRDQGIKTVAVGTCASACSLIFMGGRARAFGEGYVARSTFVGIHGAHITDTKRVDPMLMPQMYALYKQQIGDRFDSAVINQALYQLQDATGMLRLPELQRNAPNDRTPTFCPSAQTPLARCVRHEGKDAFTLGVVTQVESEKLDLPQSMRYRQSFFGRALMQPSIDVTSRVAALLEQACGTDPVCRTRGSALATRYQGAADHRAVAIGLDQPGYGMSWGGTTSEVAQLRALGQCNHVPDRPRLCRLVAVNDYEVSSVYEEIGTASEAMLQALPEPDAKAVLAEAQEPGGATTATLRRGAELSGMTPAALQGITRLDTAALRAMLVATPRPIVVDVATRGPMIPGAVNLANAGAAYDDPVQDKALDERFKRMLSRVTPDRQHPVVFYCEGALYWHSANAAMRARLAGYEQVYWYRGGQSAWQAAGMPTTARAPVAFIY